MRRRIPERFALTFQAKLFLAFAAGGLLAAFLLFAAASYYINTLQKRNVKAAIELAQEQARQLAREIVQVMHEEQSSSLSGGKVAERVRPLTQVILRQNKRIIWAGIFDPKTGNYVVEQTNEAEQVFRTRSFGDSPYRSDVSVEGRTPVEVVVRQTGTGQSVPEVRQTIDNNGKPVGEIRLRLAESLPYGRIEATSQQITRALAIQAFLLLGVLLTVFFTVWRLVRRHVELVTRNVELAQMAYVGTLASGLAHEIRNPLNAMSINLQLAEEDLAGAEADPKGSYETTTRLLKRVRCEIEHLNETLSRFLEFALPTRESVTRFPLAGVVQEIIDAHRPELESRGISITVNVSSSADTHIEGDRRLIYQAVRNIFLNAIQAVSNSVRKHIELTLIPEKNNVTLVVADTGPGIPEDNLPHVFDAFYTTKKGGTGLGLAIAKKIVQEHGGTVEAANDPNRGAVFTIRLPRESCVTRG